VTSELQQTRYDKLIRRAGGIIGPGSKVSEVLTELFPVLDVERVPGELLALAGTRICQGSAAATAVVNRNEVQVFNPAGSGVITTVTRVMLSLAATSILRWVTTAIPLGGAGLTNQRDTRVGAIEPTTTQCLFDNLAGPIASQMQIVLPANTLFQLEDENGIAVLAPGNGLTFEPDVLGTAIIAAFFWRERSVEQSEVSFT